MICNKVVPICRLNHKKKFLEGYCTEQRGLEITMQSCGNGENIKKLQDSRVTIWKRLMPEHSTTSSPTQAKLWGKQQMQITMETSSVYPRAKSGAELPPDAVRGVCV